MTYKIVYEANPRHEETQLLGNGIMAYAKQKMEFDPINFFAFFIRDDNNEIRGGCNGCNLYGCLYIDQLWIEESLRSKGYGTSLMETAEKWGIANGCTFSAVNTMSWEALEFYKKRGFYIEFERRGFLKDSIFYFLRKDFSND